MTLKNYLFSMSLATLLTWGVFAFILNIVDPQEANTVGLILFYLSLFLSLSGTAALIGFLIRFKILKKEMAFTSVKIAFRQSFLFALIIIAALFLLSRGLFTWLNLILLVLVVSVLEFLLISYKK